MPIEQTKQTEQPTKEHVLENYNRFDMNRELYRYEFTERELVTFIDQVSMSDVLASQVLLSMEFVADYILNPQYHISDRDESLTIDDVISRQTHINKKELCKCLVDKGYVIEE